MAPIYVQVVGDVDSGPILPPTVLKKLLEQVREQEAGKIKSWLTSVSSDDESDETSTKRPREASDLDESFHPPAKRPRRGPDDESSAPPAKRPRQGDAPDLVSESLEPPAKRQRRGDDAIGEMPTAPSPTSDEPTSSSDLASRPKTPDNPSKRSNQEAGLDTTPKASEPSKKAIKTSKIEDYEDLAALEKPFLVKELKKIRAAAIRMLPSDVRALCEQLSKLWDRQGVIPHELRGGVEELLGRTLPDGWVRTPDPKLTSARAQRLLHSMETIIRDAGDCQRLHRHECGWNMAVHAPILQLVFASTHINGPPVFANDPDLPVSPLAARLEAATHATIAGDSLPLMREINKDGDVFMVPCTVSADTDFREDQEQSESEMFSRLPGLTEVRSSASKVDYVVVLDYGESAAMKKTLQHLLHFDKVFGASSERRHINQTHYGPLRESPIAISIETKSAIPSSDPVLQLGLWAAAWHKRMLHLRSALADNLLKTCGAVLEKRPRLVTMPLIQVVGHHWTLHFACDDIDQATIYTGTPLGSTETLEDLLVLVASLEAIKSWVETQFCASMEYWFGNGPGATGAVAPVVHAS